MRRTSELAIEAQTFTAAISAVCGGIVRIRCDGRACTDGATIHLPRPADVMDEVHFKGLLGIGCHEAAHIYYGSPGRFRTYVESKSAPQQTLAADCFNAVLDVADETRFERRFSKSLPYFAASTTLAACEYVTGGNANRQCNSAREALVRGIFCVQRARICDSRAYQMLWLATLRDSVSTRCAFLLADARTTRGQGLPNRSAADWSRLVSISDSLVAFLEQSGLNKQLDSTNGEAEIWRHSSVFACGGGMGDVFRAVTTAATDGTVVFATAGPAFEARPSGESLVAQAAFDQAAPLFRRHARRLLEAPIPHLHRPANAGPRLGDVTRLDIDGRVFVRRAPKVDVGTAIAICLDCSDSMEDELAQVAGTASALAAALKAARGNVACFHFGSEVYRRPVRQMGRAVTLGSTRTDLAIEQASQWLEIQSEPRQIIVMFTDGAADDQFASQAQVISVRRRRTAILVGVLSGVDHELVELSLPGAEVFEIGDDLVAGFQQAIRRIARHLT